MLISQHLATQQFWPGLGRWHKNLLEFKNIGKNFMQNKLLVITLISSFLIIGLLYFILNDQTSVSRNEANRISAIDPSNCIPTFADGGGPYYQPNTPFRKNLAPGNNKGVKLAVNGKILEKDCKTPVSNAVLDVWQANESGNYEDEWYRGQIRTGRDGSYKFETVIPKGYGEGTAFRPPHIHFKVWLDGKELITSQMFFPESKGKPGFNDAYIMEVESKNNNSFEGYHDIILP